MSKLWRWRSVVSPSIVPLRNFAKLIRTAICMVAKANDRLLLAMYDHVLLAPCHDEFHGPRSDYVRQPVLNQQPKAFKASTVPLSHRSDRLKELETLFELNKPIYGNSKKIVGYHGLMMSS
ncbi:hypothetical protein TNCV_164081 [Trichonephila clavipes]|nr:hypothetical protein TNCV_164081 [Trichonephila clavipes]